MTDSPDTPDSPGTSDSGNARANADAEAAEDADTLESEDATDPDEDDQELVRSKATDELWEELGIAPVEVSLPGGNTGYTLRAYRPASQLTPTEAPAADEDEDDLFAERERARAAEDAGLAGGASEELDQEDGEPAPEEFLDESDEASEEADEAEEETEEETADEDVPVFLSHRGKLLLFGSPESLVTFIDSDAPHDLAQLDTWPTAVKRVRPTDLVPLEDDVYELDRVVENLRSGHESWDLPLLISAGEFARDVGFALRITPVITALAPGSPLDDLDEAVRAAASGGIGGLFARRRLRRIGAQQASLGWRTVIGKISAAVDWRD